MLRARNQASLHELSLSGGTKPSYPPCVCVAIHIAVFGFVSVFGLQLHLKTTLFPSQPAGSAFCWGRKAPLSHVIEMLPEEGGCAGYLCFSGRFGSGGVGAETFHWPQKGLSHKNHTIKMLLLIKRKILVQRMKSVVDTMSRGLCP